MSNNQKIILGTAIGAVAGFLIGNIIGKKNTEKECSKGMCQMLKYEMELVKIIENETGIAIPDDKLKAIKDKAKSFGCII